MTILIDNWQFIALIFIIILIVGYVAFIIYTKQIDKVQQWLLLVVSEAEKYFGSQTGKLKLRYAYDAFVDKYKWLKLFVSFERFSEMVDLALIDMRRAIENNKAIEQLIVGDSSE